MVDPSSLTAVLGGRFRPGQVLGAGPASTVVAATDSQLGAAAVVRLWAPDALDAAARAQLKADAAKLTALVHPNLVRVLAVDAESPTAAVALQRVEGRTLEQLMVERARAWSVDEVAALLSPLTSGLAALHRAGLVHREVRPGNVLQGPDGHVTLLEPGLGGARPPAPGAAPRVVRYLAPEQAQGQPADARSDVWALGVLLYELLAGRPPFDAPGGAQPPAELAQAFGVPAPVSRVVARALAAALADRFQSASALQGAWNVAAQSAKQRPAGAAASAGRSPSGVLPAPSAAAGAQRAPVGGAPASGTPAGGQRAPVGGAPASGTPAGGQRAPVGGAPASGTPAAGQRAPVGGVAAPGTPGGGLRSPAAKPVSPVGAVPAAGTPAGGSRMPAAKPSAPVAASGTPAGGQRPPGAASSSAGASAGAGRQPAPAASPPSVAHAPPARTPAPGQRGVSGPGPQGTQPAASPGGPSLHATQPMVPPGPPEATQPMLPPVPSAAPGAPAGPVTHATQPLVAPGAAAPWAGPSPHATQPMVPPDALLAPAGSEPEPAEPTFVLPDDQLAAALGMLRGGGPMPALAPPVPSPAPPAAAVLGPEPATIVPAGGDPSTLPGGGVPERTTTRVPAHGPDFDPEQTRPEGALPSLAVPPDEGQSTSPALALPSLATEDSTGEIRDAAEVARRLAALGERLDPPPPPRPLVPLGSESGPFMLPATSSERKRDMHLASDSNALGYVRDVSKEDTRTLDIPMPNLAAGAPGGGTEREVTALDRPRPPGEGTVPSAGPGTLPEAPAARPKPRLSLGLILVVLVLAALAGAFTAWRLAKARGQGRLERPGATLLATLEGAEPRWRGTAKLGN